MEGWIKIHRKIFDNPYYFSEKFCRSMAWIDLLLLANHEPGFFYKRGIRVEVAVGQVGYDVTTLAKRWKWSRNKLERWFRELEKDKQIERQKNNVTTLITIINYSVYQDNGKAKGKANDKPNDKPKGKAEKHEQEVLQEVILKNEKNIYTHIPPDFQIIKDRVQERNLQKINPEAFFAHYEANGWMVGNRKMRNWDAALTYWENNNINNNGSNKQSNQRSDKRVNDYWNNQG